MPDYKTLFPPSQYIEAADLRGKDAACEIESVSSCEVVGDGGKTDRKGIIAFKGKAKRLVLNKTNAKTISAVLGSRNTDDWLGKTITIYPTTCRLGRETVECVRVRL